MNIAARVRIGEIASKKMIRLAISQSMPSIPVDNIGTNVGALVDRITHDVFSTDNGERR